MKISELVDRLLQMKTIHGDAPILLEDAEYDVYDLESIGFDEIEDVGYIYLSAIK